MDLQQMKNSWHSDQHRNPFTADQLRNPRWFKMLSEVDLCRQEWRYPEAHELPEDVTERQCVKKSQGMDPSLILKIFFYLVFHGLQAREHIAVGKDNSLRLRGGAGRENDLNRGLSVNGIAHGEYRLN